MVSSGLLDDGLGKEPNRERQRSSDGEPMGFQDVAVEVRGQVLGHEPVQCLEIKRIDQCMYGLVDQVTGDPHQKATGLLLSSKAMKLRLGERCDGSHDHSHLEGGKTGRAQRWPVELCKAIIAGALDEMKQHVIGTAFPAEAEMEDKEEFGLLDYSRFQRHC